MRPSPVRLSGMPDGKHYMGWWGDMGGPLQKGIVQTTESSLRHRPMAGAMQGYLFYGFKRVASHFPFVVAPVAIGYSVYAWAKSYDAWQSSKAGHLALAEHEGGHH